MQGGSFVEFPLLENITAQLLDYRHSLIIHRVLVQKELKSVCAVNLAPKADRTKSSSGNTTTTVICGNYTRDLRLLKMSSAYIFVRCTKMYMCVL